MDMSTYRNIKTTIQNFRGLSKTCLDVLKKKFPNVDSNALYSILALEYQKRMKVNHIRTKSVINKYWSLYQEAVANGENAGILLRLSKQFDVCPCLIAKVILQKYFENHEEIEQTQINNYLRDTSSIPDMDLAYEVFLCTIYDNLYGPITDTLRQSLGQQYEIKLHNEVMKLGLAFRDEEHLRKYGYDKTPDVKLDVPVAIDGFIINWIESKALFGSEDAHKEYTKNQYLSYWNRFGPGLVIYWFGYPTCIINKDDKRFIVKDHLPKNIQQLFEIK